MSLPPESPSSRSADGHAEVGPPTLLAEYTEYEDAQKAIDTLSDSGFPVAATSIVWNRLRRVEHVTGRKTAVTAFRDGALSGAWFGSFIGLMLLFFVERQEGASGLALILTYLVVGALVGGAWSAVGHLAQRGTRDFSSRNLMAAESYQVWVDADVIDKAAGILGLPLPSVGGS
ncbi:MAG: general stress protein [Acidimicrobiales bacterium]